MLIRRSRERSIVVVVTRLSWQATHQLHMRVLTRGVAYESLSYRTFSISKDSLMKTGIGGINLHTRKHVDWSAVHGQEDILPEDAHGEEVKYDVARRRNLRRHLVSSTSSL